MEKYRTQHLDARGFDTCHSKKTKFVSQCWKTWYPNFPYNDTLFPWMTYSFGDLHLMFIGKLEAPCKYWVCFSKKANLNHCVERKGLRVLWLPQGHTIVLILITLLELTEEHNWVSLGIYRFLIHFAYSFVFQTFYVWRKTLLRYESH